MNKIEIDSIRIKINDSLRVCQDILFKEKNDINISKMENNKANILTYTQILKSENKLTNSEEKYSNSIIDKINFWLR